MPATASPTRRFFRPTWAEVDLGRLSRNLRRLKARLGRRSKLMFVVKADAYGHGAAACAKAAEAGGATDWLGVSSVEEGVALREAGVRLPVLILGSLYPFESFLAAAAYRLTPTVASLESARRLAAAAKRLGRRVEGHLKIETGMGRIGVGPAAAAQVAAEVLKERWVRLSGAYTHLSCAESSRAFTAGQLSRFSEALGGLDRLGAGPLLRHAANSVALLRYPESRLDMARPGLAAYGLLPGFEPVLSWKTRVVFLKSVPKGTPVSYGATFRTRRPSRIATLPVGYADGLSRGLANKGFVLLGGRRCPIVGAVTMDMVMADATDLPSVRVGDEAVLVGEQGGARQGVGDLARLLGAIPYEVVCGISRRVPRVSRA